MKKLFIQAMMNMVDNKTIFKAHPGFWGQIFDKIESGITDGVDPTFHTVYQTIKAVHLVQSSPDIKRQNNIEQEQQILLNAIDKRIQGRYVYIICLNQVESAHAEQAFFKLVDVLRPVLINRGITTDLLAKGAIRFININRAEYDGFNWATLRMPGIDPRDALYIMPSVVDRHYAPFMDAYKQHSREIEPSPFVKTLQVVIEQHFRNSQSKSGAWEVMMAEEDYR